MKRYKIDSLVRHTAHNGAVSVDERKETSIHRNGLDDISISEEQMMMDVPSIVRGEMAALQHGQVEDDELCKKLVLSFLLFTEYL